MRTLTRGAWTGMATITATAALTLGSGAETARAREVARWPAAADSVLGVFEGRTPCGPIANDFTGFPSQNCEKIKWRLTLHVDAATRRPTTFLYEGTRTARRGAWTIQRGTPFDPDAEVYHLTPAPAGRALSLLSVDGQVLVLLDGDRRVVKGDASWSYVLNRVSRP